MFYKLNLQYLLSYLGILPYFFLLLDKYLLIQIETEVRVNFIIYYTLIIIVFIGSINWNLEKKILNRLVVYGFLPSICATLIIILNLYSFDTLKLFLLIILILIGQLFFDYFIIFKNSINKKPFYFLRLPLTLLIILSLVLL